MSRKAPSLGNLLSPSLFSSKTSSNNWLSFKGTFRCGGQNCTYCSRIKGGDIIISSSTGKTHKIHSFANCNTRYVIYVITCTTCSVQYVGRTILRLKDRLYDHLYDIEKKITTRVSHDTGMKFIIGIPPV